MPHNATNYSLEGTPIDHSYSSNIWETFKHCFFISMYVFLSKNRHDVKKRKYLTTTSMFLRDSYRSEMNGVFYFIDTDSFFI